MNALTNTGTDTATNFDLGNFEKLLERLEASKGRQQRQKSVEGRRDIFQQGLAGMMSNFWFKKTISHDNAASRPG